MPKSDLAPVGAFAGMQVPKANRVAIRPLDGLGIATILARKGQDAALSARIRERFGFDLPRGPELAGADHASFLGTAPGTWLAISEGGGNDFASSLRDALGGLASVADQSDGLAVVHVAGSHVRDALCKLFTVDLDGSAFKVGDVAVTPAGHVGATLWRVDDEQGAAAFRLAVHRSFAASFWEHLAEAAAEF